MYYQDPYRIFYVPKQISFVVEIGYIVFLKVRLTSYLNFLSYLKRDFVFSVYLIDRDISKLLFFVLLITCLISSSNPMIKFNI